MWLLFSSPFPAAIEPGPSDPGASWADVDVPGVVSGVCWDDVDVPGVVSGTASILLLWAVSVLSPLLSHCLRDGLQIHAMHYCLLAVPVSKSQQIKSS